MLCGTQSSSPTRYLLCSIISDVLCWDGSGSPETATLKQRHMQTTPDGPAQQSVDGGGRAAHKESGPNPTQGFLCSFERSPAGSLCQYDSGAWQIKGHQHSSSGSGWRSVQTRCRFISGRGFPAAATLEKISRQASRQWDDQSSATSKIDSVLRRNRQHDWRNESALSTKHSAWRVDSNDKVVNRVGDNQVGGAITAPPAANALRRPASA